MEPSDTSRKALKALFISILFAALAAAQNPKTLAILDFEGHGISQSDAVVLTSRLRSLLVLSGAYTIIERDEMLRILQEQDFQMTGCTSNECAVEIGQILSAQLMLAGEIGRVGNYFTVECRVIDVETARIIQAMPYEISGDDIGVLLLKGIPEVVEKIMGIGYTSFVVGSLNVITEPAGATVNLDSIEIDEKTPTTIKGIPAGTHVVELVRNMENYGKVRIAKEVDVQPGQVLMIREEFQNYMAYGELEIKTIPDNVALTTKHKGSTVYTGLPPIRLERLVPGEYFIEVESDSFEQSISVVIHPNQSTLVNLALYSKLSSLFTFEDIGESLEKETKNNPIFVITNGMGSIVIHLGFRVGGLITGGYLGYLIGGDKAGGLLIVIGMAIGMFTGAEAGFAIVEEPLPSFIEKLGIREALPNNKAIEHNQIIKQRLDEMNKSIRIKNEAIQKYNNSLPRPTITFVNQE